MDVFFECKEVVITLPDDLSSSDVLQHVTQREEDSSHCLQLCCCLRHWVLVQDLLLQRRQRDNTSVQRYLSFSENFHRTSI